MGGQEGEKAMKQRRNRQPAPKPLATGDTLETCRADPEFLRWCQQSYEFRRLVAMLTNERLNAFARAHIPLHTASEGVHLGMHLGYEAALTTLRLAQQGRDPAPPQPLEATYQSEDDIEKQLKIID